MRLPPTENSFQSSVPTGNRHASTSDVSIVAPAGSRIHLRFVAPSLHRANDGR